MYIAIGQAPDYEYIPEELHEKLSINRGKIEANDLGQVKNAEWLSDSILKVDHAWLKIC